MWSRPSTASRSFNVVSPEVASVSPVAGLIGECIPAAVAGDRLDSRPPHQARPCLVTRFRWAGVRIRSPRTRDVGTADEPSGRDRLTERHLAICANVDDAARSLHERLSIRLAGDHLILTRAWNGRGRDLDTAVPDMGKRMRTLKWTSGPVSSVVFGRQWPCRSGARKAGCARGRDGD